MVVFLFMINFSDIKSKKLIYLWALIIILAVIIALAITFILSDKNKKKPEHYIFAESYVDLFIKDNPAEQYNLLDISTINFNAQAVENTKNNYERNPLLKENYLIAITNTREASESVLKKINNVYKSYCKSTKPGAEYVVEKAYRYNVKIKYKKNQIYNVSFWVVQSGEQLNICTVYEYERSLDRCSLADMY